MSFSLVQNVDREFRHKEFHPLNVGFFTTQDVVKECRVIDLFYRSVWEEKKTSCGGVRRGLGVKQDLNSFHDFPPPNGFSLNFLSIKSETGPDDKSTLSVLIWT